jgi:uncharacterized protein
MTDLVVRRLLIDLETPFPLRWFGGDAFRSALFNALSMSFPVGEQFFMDSVRAGLKALPEEKRAAFEKEVQGFVAQEATHRRIHETFNAQLDRHGCKNTWAVRSAARIKRNEARGVKFQVASTAAIEHFTAILSAWMFRNPQIFEDTEQRLVTLWRWHAAEEAEHRSTAFDMFRALEGSEEGRCKVFRVITVIFLSNLVRQTIRNLWHDNSLFKWSTWRSAYKVLFVKDGMFRGNIGPWREYLAPDFHPTKQAAPHAEAWLGDHSDQYAVVGRA